MKKFFSEAAVFTVRLVSGVFTSFGVRACRFHPSCSAYSTEAFRSAGFFRASALTLARLSRCHPFSRGGYDPLTFKK